MRKFSILALFLCLTAFADTPPPGTVKIKDSAGNSLSSSSGSLDVNVTGGSVTGTVAVSNFPAVQAVSQNGAWITGRTWALLSGTDFVSAVQSGTWSVGRTWALTSGADSISSVQSGTWNVGLSAGANTIGKVDQGAGGASAWKVDGSAVTQPVSGTVNAAQSGAWNITNVTGTVSLPTGASTAANQATEISSLSTIATNTGNIPTVGQKTMSASTPVAIASDQSTLPISAASLPLPAGAATSALQTTANTSLSSIDGKLNSLGQKVSASSMPVVISSDQSAIPITGSITATNPSIGTNGSAGPSMTTQVGGVDGSGNLQAAKVNASHAFLVDGSAVTQPVSAASLPLPAGAATSTLQTTGNTSLSSIDSKVPANLTVTATRLLTDGSGVTQPVSGTVTANAGTGTFTVGQATGTNLHTVVDSGAVTANIGTTNGLALDATVANIQGSVSGGTAGTKSSLSGGQFLTSAPTLTNGQQAALQLDVNGNLKTTATLSASTVTANQGTPNSAANGWPVKPTDGTNSQSFTGAGEAKVSVTQPLPAGSNTIGGVNQAGTWTVQPGNTANTTPWLATINQGGNSASVTGSNALKVDGSAVTQPVSGTVTASQATASSLNAQVVGNVASGASDSGNPVKIGGVFNTTLPTLTNGQRGDLQLASNGGLIVSGAATVGAAPVSNPISVSGVDGGGLKRHFLMDTSGRTQILLNDTSGNGITSTLINSKQRLDVGTSYEGTDGAATPFHSISVGGLDGSGNLQTLKTDTNGNLNTLTMDGSGNSVTSTVPPGGVTNRGLDNNIVGSSLLEVTGTGSALAQTPIPSTNVGSYRSVSIQTTLTGTNTSIFEGSNDNTTFTAVQCMSAAVANATPVTTVAASGLFICPIFYKFFRTRVSAFTSGSMAMIAEFSPLPAFDMGLRNVSGSGTFTVSGTNNPSANILTNISASSAKTVTGNSGSVTIAAPGTSAAFVLNLTAVSGTNPVLDVIIETSSDSGTTFNTVYSFNRLTATGQEYTPVIAVSGNRVRASWTISGTTPSFTFSVAYIGNSGSAPIMYRFYDRNLVPATTNSTTSSYNIEGCQNITYGINLSAAAASPAFNLQLSEDGTLWTTVGSTLNPTSGALVQFSSVSNTYGKFARLITSTNDAGATLNYVWLRCR